MNENEIDSNKPALTRHWRGSHHRWCHAVAAADHHISDGLCGAVFLNTVNRLLQKPEAL